MRSVDKRFMSFLPSNPFGGTTAHAGSRFLEIRLFRFGQAQAPLRPGSVSSRDHGLTERRAISAPLAAPGMTMKRLLYCVGAIGGKVQVPSRIASRGWYKRRE